MSGATQIWERLVGSSEGRWSGYKLYDFYSSSNQTRIEELDIRPVRRWFCVRHEYRSSRDLEVRAVLGARGGAKGVARDSHHLRKGVQVSRTPGGVCRVRWDLQLSTSSSGSTHSYAEVLRPSRPGTPQAMDPSGHLEDLGRSRLLNPAVEQGPEVQTPLQTDDGASQTVHEPSVGSMLKPFLQP